VPLLTLAALPTTARSAMFVCRLGFAALVLVRNAQAQEPAVIDLVCGSGKNAAVWQQVKAGFRSAFADGKALLGVPQEQLATTLTQARSTLDAAGALAPANAEECGTGKLSLQMLTMTTLEDPIALSQLFSGVERLSSPVMTLILELPWLAIAQSGWPLFALLAQVNQRRVQAGATVPQEVDGLDGKYEPLFLRELYEALAKGDSRQLEESSRIFASIDDTKGSALAALTAVAGQAAADRPPQEKVLLLEQLQNGFRQAIGSAPELDIALGTQWPLFGLIHFVLEQLAL